MSPACTAGGSSSEGAAALSAAPASRQPSSLPAFLEGSIPFQWKAKREALQGKGEAGRQALKEKEGRSKQPPTTTAAAASAATVVVVVVVVVARASWVIWANMVAAHTSHASSSNEWIACLDKRPLERSSEDIDIIFTRLKEVKAFEKFHPNLLQQICLCGYYENLEKGITLFRQGDIGTNWYAVLTGSLDVKVSDTSNHQDAVTICTLGIGTAFGESILDNTPRHATIVTRENSELLRIEQKDFKALWEIPKLEQGPVPHGTSGARRH